MTGKWKSEKGEGDSEAIHFYEVEKTGINPLPGNKAMGAVAAQVTANVDAA